MHTKRVALILACVAAVVVIAGCTTTKTQTTYDAATDFCKQHNWAYNTDVDADSCFRIINETYISKPIIRMYLGNGTATVYWKGG